MSSTNSKQENRTVKRSRKRYTPFIAVAIIIFIVMVTGAGLGFLTASIHTAPGLTGDFIPAASSQLFDVNGKVITTIHSVENRIPVSLNKIPQDLQSAFLAAEDIRFYQHSGVDIRAIGRAVLSNILDRGVSEGGSTITQQLAKNALLTQERTLKRKIQEAVLALQIERQYSKQEIFGMYLNQIYFGAGAYGVQAAAQVYFGKNAEDLSLPECAMLAGLPKSPNYYSPLNNMKAAKERQRVVLDQMVKYGFIDSATAAKAAKAEIKLAAKAHDSGFASYFIDYITQILIDKYGADAVYKDGLKIYTTLDIGMQRAAEKTMNNLPSTSQSNGIKQPQGALVCLDPHTGYIKAMVGGRGGDQFNRAVLAERQPGSAFKPFVYLAALENGMTAATIIDDKQISYAGGWTPQNYDHKFRGPISLRRALELSLNGVAVQVAQQVGPDKALQAAQQMGISTLVMQGAVSDRNLAMSLGGLTRGVTPLEIASAYGVLANQGVRMEPTAIIKVVGRNGQILEEHKAQGKAVISERSAYLLTDLMKGVLQRGTGAGANIGRPAAGKTGTTSDYHDAWFIGYTPDLVAAVWIGNDNNADLDGITGGTLPATMWREFMSAATASLPARDFPRPSGIVAAAVSTKDGLLAKDPKDKDANNEIFIEGTQPTKISTYDPDKEKKPDEKDAKPGDAPDGKTPAATTDEKLPPPPPRGNSAVLPPPPPDKPAATKNNP
ncbi:MAG: penicillin-binding protein 1A [Sporomusaceae bacterium]|nr:penicillin-binding protein 1A [Sporomusaceae bacterium]